MMLHNHRLDEARTAVQRMLDLIGLESVAHTLEPSTGDWRLRLECAKDGWWSLSTPIDPALLCESLRDDAARDQLRALLDNMLHSWPRQSR